MKRLLLLRHAKSAWDDPTLGDQARPLSERGLRDAPRMARHLFAKGYLPDFVLCSVAERTRQTARLILAALNISLPTVFDKRIYSEDVHAIHRLIASSSDAHDCILLIGHYPEMQRLVEELTGEAFPFGKYSTCAVSVIEFSVVRWDSILEERGVLAHFMRPKDLK